MLPAAVADVGLHVDTTACFLVSVVFGRGIYSDSHKATGWRWFIWLVAVELVSVGLRFDLSTSSDSYCVVRCNLCSCVMWCRLAGSDAGPQTGPRWQSWTLPTSPWQQAHTEQVPNRHWEKAAWCQRKLKFPLVSDLHSFWIDLVCLVRQKFLKLGQTFAEWTYCIIHWFVQFYGLKFFLVI